MQSASHSEILFIQFCGQLWDRIRCFRNVIAESLSIVRAEKEKRALYLTGSPKETKCFRKCVQHDLPVWARNPFSPITFLEMVFSFFAQNNQWTTLIRAATGASSSAQSAHRTSTGLAALPRTTWFPSP